MTTPARTASDIAHQIEGAWAAHLARDRRASAPHPYVYASAWRPCTRRMVYDMRALTKPEFSPDTLAKFRRGADRERDLLADLGAVGRNTDPPFQVIGQQEAFRLKDRKGRVAISGKVDGRLQVDGIKAPVEVKTWSAHLTDRIETFDDLFDSPWTRPGAYQLLAYLFGAGEPCGFLLLDRSGLPTVLPVELEPHLDRVEDFLARAEQAIDHVEADTLPEFLVGDAAECTRCDWHGHTCTPPLTAPSPAVLLDPALEQALERREILQAGAQEYMAIDEDIKARLRGTEHAVIGAFAIKGRWGKHSRLVVPADLKRQWTVTDPKGRFTLEITRVIQRDPAKAQVANGNV